MLSNLLYATALATCMFFGVPCAMYSYEYATQMVDRRYA